jgi:uncharacterized protein YqeY
MAYNAGSEHPGPADGGPQGRDARRVELQKQAFDARGGAESEGGEAIQRRALSDEQIVGVVERLVKRHQDSIAEFQKAGRDDLVRHEESQLAIVAEYLPYKLFTQAEIEAAVRTAITETGASGPRDLGKLMPRLSGELRGKADMNQVRRVVQEMLGG